MNKILKQTNRTFIWSTVLILVLFVVFFIKQIDNQVSPELTLKPAKAANSSNYGVVSFVSSFQKSVDKATAVAKISAAGFGWVREEYTYPVNDFAPYDSAYSKIKGANLQILGLLTYPGGGLSHADWQSYVSKVVGHFPGVSAWEIMNEADNYLSPTDYAQYLKEANQIIKSKGSATVICSGVGARKEVYPFWDGIAAAGAWGSFDAVGLHMFHDGTPYEDSYNNGTFPQEVQKVINTINNNGGGKPIWVTELGYDSNNYGATNQANWLVESLKIIQGFSEVQKVFIFRLCDYQNGLGLLGADFSEKEAYLAVKNWLAGGLVPSVPETPTPVPEVVEIPVNGPSEGLVETTPRALVDKTKSFIRLDGTDIAPDAKAQYRIVVSIKDVDGKILVDRKPGIILSGGQTSLTDFILVGNEWFAYVSSSEPGERTAKISADGQDLGELKMTFVVPKSVVKPVLLPEVAEVASLSARSNYLLIFNLIGGVLILGLISFLIVLRVKKIKSTL